MDTLAAGQPTSYTAASRTNGYEAWLTYIDGSSLRRECGSIEADSYRFVYNADYNQQVRTYDLTVPGDRGHPATLVARVMSNSGVKGPNDRSLFTQQTSVWAQRTVSRTLIQPVLQALARSGFGNSVQTTATLTSDSYFWIVSACVNGQFSISAWPDIGGSDGRPSFAQQLFSLDETAVPVRYPKGTRGHDRESFWSDLFPSRPSRPANEGIFKVELTGGSALSVER